jgi:hypothetical protein
MADQEQEIFDLSCEFAREGREANYDWRQQGRKCRRFVVNKGGDDQWEEADKLALQNKGVLPITINGMLPIRDHIVGRQAQSPRDLTVLPAKGGNGVTAMIISAMLKHTIGQSYGLNLKAEMFKDGITTGRGFLGVDTDYSTDPVNGDIVLKLFSPFHVDIDMLGLQYDLNQSGRFVNTYEWEDRDNLFAHYKNAKEELGEYTIETNTGFPLKRTIQKVASWFMGTKFGEDIDLEDSQNLDEEVYSQLIRRRFPVRTSWLKTWEKVVYWADLEQQKVLRLTDAGDVARARQSVKYLPERFKIYESVLPVLHKVKAVGDIKLEYKKDPFKFLGGLGWSFDKKGNPLIFDVPALFPCVGFYAYFEDGETFGKMDNLLGPQMERNKRRTQFLRLLNSMAAAGWSWEEGSLTSEMEEKLENFGTRPDLNIKWKKQTPQKIQPVDTAGAGYLSASMTSERDMEEIASVNRESLAKRGPVQSGVAIDLKQQADNTGNEIVFSNLSYSSVIFGNLLTQIIRCGEYYSYEEIKSLIDEEDLISGPILTEAVRRVGPAPQPPQPPNQAAMQLASTQFGEKGQMLTAAVGIEYEKKVAEFQQADQKYKESIKTEGENVIMEAIGDIKVGRYGLKVVEAPTSPTLRAERFEQVVAIEKMRPREMPFKVLIDASDIPNKEKIIEETKNQQPVMPTGAGR